MITKNLIIGTKGYYIGQLISSEDYKNIPQSYKKDIKEFNIKNDFDD